MFIKVTHEDAFPMDAPSMQTLAHMPLAPLMSTYSKLKYLEIRIGAHEYGKQENP
jgi:hypothetical protein